MTANVIDLNNDTYQQQLIYKHSAAGRRDRYIRKWQRRRKKKFIKYGLLVGFMGTAAAAAVPIYLLGVF